MGRNNAAFIVIGVIALILGIVLKLFVGKRRFYRRNQAGSERFKNYRNALITPFVESILGLFGGVLIVGGICCLSIAMLVGK